MFLKTLTLRINIVDRISQMSKIAPPRVRLWIPVIGQLNLSLVVTRRRQNANVKRPEGTS